MKFKKGFLKDLWFDDEFVLKEGSGARRWSEMTRYVFEHEGKFYEMWIDVGLTENQETLFYDEYEDDDDIELDEVVKKETVVTKTVVEYVKV